MLGEALAFFDAVAQAVTSWWTSMIIASRQALIRSTIFTLPLGKVPCVTAKWRAVVETYMGHND